MIAYFVWQISSFDLFCVWTPRWVRPVFGHLGGLDHFCHQFSFLTVYFTLLVLVWTSNGKQRVSVFSGQCVLNVNTVSLSLSPLTPSATCNFVCTVTACFISSLAKKWQINNLFSMEVPWEAPEMMPHPDDNALIKRIVDEVRSKLLVTHFFSFSLA